jgi:PHP family Zn ribbon phosphoesterase
MSPYALIERAKSLRIEWIAITDHNSLANCPAYAQVAQTAGIAFTYGVEIQTSEEIHLLAYFDDPAKAMEFDSELYAALLPIPNDAEFFGDQVVIDAQENIIRIEERALSNSALWSLEEAKDWVESYDGFCIPAHVDADVNSIISQLGFLPEQPYFPVLGITSKLIVADYVSKHPEMQNRNWLRASDAHYLTDLGCGCSLITVAAPTVTELRLAADRQNDRKILV